MTLALTRCTTDFYGQRDRSSIHYSADELFDVHEPVAVTPYIIRAGKQSPRPTPAYVRKGRRPAEGERPQYSLHPVLATARPPAPARAPTEGHLSRYASLRPRDARHLDRRGPRGGHGTVLGLQLSVGDHTELDDGPSTDEPPPTLAPRAFPPPPPRRTVWRPTPARLGGSRPSCSTGRRSRSPCCRRT